MAKQTARHEVCASHERAQTQALSRTAVAVDGGRTERDLEAFQIGGKLLRAARPRYGSARRTAVEALIT